MVMTSHDAPSTARLVLLVLLTVTPRLTATPVGGDGQGEGHSRTHHKEDSLNPLHSPLEISPSPLHHPLDQTQDRIEDQVQSQEQSYGGPTNMDPARALAAMLLEALDHTRRGQTQERGEGDPVPLEERRDEETRREVGREEEEEERRVGERNMEQLGPALVAVALGEELREIEEEEEREEKKRSEDRGWLLEIEGDRAGGGSEEGGQQKEEEEEEGEAGRWGGEKEKRAEGSRTGEEGRPIDLQRKARGYFQNIDLGLQDNEILPPLKGYKAYNTQLAQAGKKLHWEEERARNTPLVGNFMDDFENEAEEEEEAALSMVEEEEARARAEQQEVQRQQEEAERAREEEQRLADIASDMLLQYMGRQKQQRAPYLTARQKQKGAPYLTARQKAGANAAEDKRSEEVVTDGDDLDQQMIDRLIEISSKLHLPADDVVQIISNVEEKKKRKELTPLSNPVAPRYRPLVTGPMYHYTASSNPKKDPYYQPYKNKWNKDRAKAKAYKQDVWFKPQKQKDVWFKPQKQFLAFPSYPYYQKPYRAYYPVFFPYPKPQYYDNTPMGEELPHSPPSDYELRPTRRRHRAGGRARGGSRHGWRQQPLPPRLPSSPYISNYILPHPRTYQPLPKPLSPQNRARPPPYYYPSGPEGLGVAGGWAGGDYEDDDGLVPQLDSQEELENFISKIYMKRRMY
ncbi:cyclin-dependent kinase 11B-like [Salvelinus fontinalis]|uniref:cyclin-dependent kinase 11B-like n=1 Tax=Salvelinus fontinalis TaxID=8038 RepID=UPI0024853197|nr:cyclin-dependent kinase 11B-like [Salvelinus fontinalis]